LRDHEGDCRAPMTHSHQPKRWTLSTDHGKFQWSPRERSSPWDIHMIAIKAARKFIEANPTEPPAKVLAELVLCLTGEVPFDLTKLYALDPKHFDLAIDVLKEWRLDRYYMGKARLFDLSLQIGQLNP
jgi:hypothetical protein